MVGAWRIAIGVAVSMIAATSSQAGCWWYAPPTYYYAAPMYYYYAPSPRVIAVPDALPKSPKQTGEPPLQGVKGDADRAPVIITTNAQTAGATKDRLQVGFWNLTGRDITLTVGGTMHTLGKNRAVTVELGREFSWQVDRLPAHIERVPDGKAAYEVVIRE